MYSKSSFCLIFIVLLISACSNNSSVVSLTVSPDTPTLQPVTTTPTATFTVTYTPTPSATSSPPTPTYTPTPEPTLTPTPNVPLFTKYTHPSQAFSFDVPNDWVLRQEGEQNVIFADSTDKTGVGVVFFEVPGELNSEDDIQTEIEGLIQTISDQANVDYEIAGQETLSDDRILVRVDYGSTESDNQTVYVFEPHKNLMFMQYFDTPDYQETLPIWEVMVGSYQSDKEAAISAISNVTTQGTLIVFHGEDFTISYPGTWLETLERCEDSLNPDDEFECSFAITLPESGNTHIHLLRADMPSASSIDEIDEELWEMLETPSSGITTISREIVEIDGKRAIKRIFTRPSPQIPDGKANILMIYFLHNESFYQFNGWANGSENFEQYSAEMEDVMSNIQFSP